MGVLRTFQCHWQIAFFLIGGFQNQLDLEKVKDTEQTRLSEHTEYQLSGGDLAGFGERRDSGRSRSKDALDYSFERKA